MSTYDDFSGPLVDADKLGLPDVPGLELPTVPEHYYVLDDDDAGECRGIYESELETLYVDNNISWIRIMMPDLWDHPDNHPLTVSYENGLTYEVQLGTIDFSPGPAADRYWKSGGMIFPTDNGGRILLDQTNTPRLVAIRELIHDEWREIQEQRLEIAEIVYNITQVMSKYSSLNAWPDDPLPVGRKWVE
jgi:hypothetical protein